MTCASAIVPLLKAMEHNYRGGHSWDHLDGEAVLSAAAIIAELVGTLAATLPRNVCLTNRNVRDDQVVALECTMGDLRRISAVLAKARGEA